MKNLGFNSKLERYWKLCMVFCLTAGLMFAPVLSSTAAEEVATTATEKGSGIGDILCKVTKELNGPIGRGISTIAVVVLGIGLFLGKLSWALAIATAIGIGLIFSAGKIVDWLGGGESTC